MSKDISSSVRTPAVAGLFYPGDATTLAREIRGYLDEPREPGFRPGYPKAIIAPHAGYVYSGPVAASAYGPKLLVAPPRTDTETDAEVGPCP